MSPILLPALVLQLSKRINMATSKTAASGQTSLLLDMFVPPWPMVFLKNTHLLFVAEPGPQRQTKLKLRELTHMPKPNRG